MRVALAVVVVLLLGFAFVHRSAPGALWQALTLAIGMAVLITAVTEIRVRLALAKAGKPVLDFGDRAFLYWRKTEGPPEEISYAEVLTYYSTELDDGEGNAEVFVTIEFRKRRRIKLRSSYLDIGPRQFLALVKLKLDGALA